MADLEPAGERGWAVGYLPEAKAPSGRAVRRAFECLLNDRTLQIDDVYLVRLTLPSGDPDVSLLVLAERCDPDLVCRLLLEKKKHCRGSAQLCRDSRFTL